MITSDAHQSTAALARRLIKHHSDGVPYSDQMLSQLNKNLKKHGIPWRAFRITLNGEPIVMLAPVPIPVIE